jgi:hypothetical protein
MFFEGNLQACRSALRWLNCPWTSDSAMSPLLSQEPAATLATWTTHACGRSQMRAGPISWRTWHISVGWWQLAWCPRLLNTAMWWPPQHTRPWEAAVPAWSSTGKVSSQEWDRWVLGWCFPCRGSGSVEETRGYSDLGLLKIPGSRAW